MRDPVLEPKTLFLVGGVLVLLAIATAVLRLLHGSEQSRLNPAILKSFRLRVQSWWVLFTVLAAAILIHRPGPTVVLFGLISFWALREFITLTPTRPGDHRTLFWVFFILTPIQFILVGLQWYELYSVLIPVLAFLFIPARIAIAGDSKRFLERTAKIQVGLLICVYCLSYAPALLTLDLPATQQGWWPKARLLFFFVLIVQVSDGLQFVWARLPSKHVIAPAIHPTKTWEGLLGSTAGATLIGGALWWATPFQGADWWMAGVTSTVIAVMSFAGGLTLSAIKRDRGVKDYGTLVEGHGGVLDRIDSLCFAAPVFFHITRFYVVEGTFGWPWG